MRGPAKLVLFAFAAFATLLAARPAVAAPSSDSDHAAAVESFRRGTQLVEAGKLQEAIDAFRNALLREPASVGARLDLADCYEKIGAPASAWREYVVAESYARRAGDARQAVARSSAAGLEAKLFVVTLAGEAPAAMEVHVDGDSIPPPIVARGSVALAPGRHRFELTAPKKRPVSAELVGSGGETRALAILFENERSPMPLAAEETPEPARAAASPQRTWGFVLGGVGVAGVGAGAVFGALALGKRSSLQAESHDSSIGSARFYADRSNADTLATVSTVAFIAGGLALAGGIALVALAPTRRAGATQLARGWIRVGALGTGTGVVVGRDF
jgi:hypothetical protein